jgi:hypothetical protein
MAQILDRMRATRITRDHNWERTIIEKSRPCSRA